MRYRRPFLLLFMLAAALPAGAQTISDFHLEAGFGLNSASIRSTITPMSPIMTVRTGAMAFGEWSYSDKYRLSVGAGLYYVDKGATFDSSIKYKLRLDYLQLPLLVRYTASLGLGVEMSPYIGIWFATALTGSATSPLGVADIPVFEQDGMWLRRSDMGAMVGISTTYNSFVLSMGVEFGGVNLTRTIGQSLYHSAFTVMLSYKIF